MAKHAKTLKLLEVAVEVLAAQHSMTVRQVYYQLVSTVIQQNNPGFSGPAV
jgi:DNA topoisomerase VI subunit A